MCLNFEATVQGCFIKTNFKKHFFNEQSSSYSVKLSPTRGFWTLGGLSSTNHVFVRKIFCITFNTLMYLAARQENQALILISVCLFW